MFLTKLEPLFRELPSTLTNSIVKDHSLPFLGKMLFGGRLCYFSSYVIFRESFIYKAFLQPSVFFDANVCVAYS